MTTSTRPMTLLLDGKVAATLEGTIVFDAAPPASAYPDRLANLTAFFEQACGDLILPARFLTTPPRGAR